MSITYSTLQGYDIYDIELSYAHVIVTFRYRWCRPHQLAVAQLLRLGRYVSVSEKLDLET